MNPNSKNQLWSKWTWTVYPGRKVALPFEPLKQVIAKFTRGHFGSASQMRITEKLDHYIIELLTEGKPAHDYVFVDQITARFQSFFKHQFGPGTQTSLSGPRLMAGSRQDGSPPDQMIILPSLKLDELMTG